MENQAAVQTHVDMSNVYMSERRHIHHEQL